MLNILLFMSAILLICIDFIYLNIIKKYFFKQIQIIQGSKPKINFLGALLCYIFLIVGINYFIIKPQKSVYDAFLLGIIIYGVYETTNYTVFDKWPVFIVVIDTLWGGILFALTTYIINLLR